jgi:hypothetical protein
MGRRYGVASVIASPHSPENLSATAYFFGCPRR